MKKGTMLLVGIVLFLIVAIASDPLGFCAQRSHDRAAIRNQIAIEKAEAEKETKGGKRLFSLRQPRPSFWSSFWPLSCPLFSAGPHRPPVIQKVLRGRRSPQTIRIPGGITRQILPKKHPAPGPKALTRKARKSFPLLQSPTLFSMWIRKAAVNFWVRKAAAPMSETAFP